MSRRGSRGGRRGDRTRGGRVTPRATRTKMPEQSSFQASFLPTDIAMAREDEQGIEAVTVRFRQPNVEFAQKLASADWRRFITDLLELIDRVQEVKLDRSASGLVVAGSGDVEAVARAGRQGQ